MVSLCISCIVMHTLILAMVLYLWGDLYYLNINSCALTLGYVFSCFIKNVFNHDIFVCLSASTPPLPPSSACIQVSLELHTSEPFVVFWAIRVSPWSLRSYWRPLKALWVFVLIPTQAWMLTQSWTRWSVFCLYTYIYIYTYIHLCSVTHHVCSFTVTKCEGGEEC